MTDIERRMLIAEYQVPTYASMSPPAEVVRLYRLGQAEVQVDVLEDGVRHIRWWYTGRG